MLLLGGSWQFLKPGFTYSNQFPPSFYVFPSKFKPFIQPVWNVDFVCVCIFYLIIPKAWWRENLFTDEGDHAICAIFNQLCNCLLSMILWSYQNLTEKMIKRYVTKNCILEVAQLTVWMQVVFIYNAYRMSYTELSGIMAWLNVALVWVQI